MLSTLICLASSLSLSGFKQSIIFIRSSCSPRRCRPLMLQILHRGMFCNVCGGERTGQPLSPARVGCYEGLFVCTDQAVSARMVCKMRCTIGSCCSRRNLPQILQEILLRPEFAESIARLLEFGPREIACAFRNMLQIPFVPMPLPSSVTDCILSFLRTDFT